MTGKMNFPLVLVLTLALNTYAFTYCGFEYEEYKPSIPHKRTFIQLVNSYYVDTAWELGIDRYQHENIDSKTFNQLIMAVLAGDDYKKDNLQTGQVLRSICHSESNNHTFCPFENNGLNPTLLNTLCNDPIAIRGRMTESNATCLTFYGDTRSYYGDSICVERNLRAHTTYCYSEDFFNPLCDCITAHANLYCSLVGLCPGPGDDLVISGGSILCSTYYGHSDTFNNGAQDWVNKDFYLGKNNKENVYEMMLVASKLSYLSQTGQVSFLVTQIECP